MQTDLHSASSLKQQSAGRHVSPLGHIIPIPSQPVFDLTLSFYVLTEEATNANLLVFDYYVEGQIIYSYYVEGQIIYFYYVEGQIIFFIMLKVRLFSFITLKSNYLFSLCDSSNN
jgi:hypothetical protein